MSLRKPGMTAKLHKLSSTSLFCGVKLIVCLLIFKYFSHNFRLGGGNSLIHNYLYKQHLLPQIFISGLNKTRRYFLFSRSFYRFHSIITSLQVLPKKKECVPLQ